MDEKDYIIEKLAREKIQLDVELSRLEFAFRVLQNENGDLKKKVEEMDKIKEENEDLKKKVEEADEDEEFAQEV